MQPRIANWGIVRPFRKIGKLNKTLTIPTFSVRCGNVNQSLYIGNEGGAAFGSSMTDDLSTAFTLEAWIKCFARPTGTYRFIVGYGHVATNSVRECLRLDGQYLQCQAYKGGIEYTRTSTYPIPENQWVHVACVFDNTNVYLYINGELDSTQALVGPLDNAPNGNAVKVLADFTPLPSGSYYSGSIANAIVRNIALTSDAIKFGYDKVHNVIPGDSIDDDIISYFTFYGESLELITNTSIDLPFSTVVYEEDFFSSKYGSSFIPIQFSVVTDRKHSLKFPITGPTERNFGLQVAWLDDNDNLQRRRLLDPTIKPLDINPLPAEYNGERLPEEYTLEVWNIDGYESVDLTEELILDTSILSDPQSSVDHTQLALATPTQRTALYEPLPLTGFPLAFDNAPTDWI